MDELVKLIVAKTGISQDQAKTAIDDVVNFLKLKKELLQKVAKNWLELPGYPIR